MILTPYELPSNGKDKNSEPIEITGLGFQDLLIYSREYESANTPLKKYLVDFNWIKKVISNWQKINLVDLDAVILRWKIECVSGKKEFTTRKRCPECGNQLDLSLEVQQLSIFNPLEFNLENVCEINGVTYRYLCPNLEFFDKVVSKVTRSGRIKDIEILKLISMFPDFADRPNQIESMVLNAKNEDIQVLRTLSSIFLRSTISIKAKCPKCKCEDWSMRVASLIDDPFLSLALSSGTIEDKIRIE